MCTGCEIFEAELAATGKRARSEEETSEPSVKIRTSRHPCTCGDGQCAKE